VDPATASETFYDRVPVFRGFPRLMDETLYRPLPQDWVIGSADVVASTRAIRENRYKAVNMAGAAVIASVANALGREFPFVFGGDGASFAVPPQWADATREALAATLCWTREELQLELRGAMVPVSAVRENGFDVRIARFAPSENVSYAMFTGGGLAWAETAMKQGRFAVAAAPSGIRPDLTGLSCRFEEMPSLHGLVLALLVVPGERAGADDFRRVVDEIVHLVDEEGHAPVPAGAPKFGWPPQGVELEAHVSHRPGESIAIRRAAVLFRTLFYFLILRFRLRVGGFVPALYLKQVVENSDFRKYDDALRMIVDCKPELADEIERRLAIAAGKGIVRFGTHRQEAAMMTCFTPSPTHADHMHFVDGASGGYALAALALKSGEKNTA
jgi:hypothetical protein